MKPSKNTFCQLIVIIQENHGPHKSPELVKKGSGGTGDPRSTLSRGPSLLCAIADPFTPEKNEEFLVWWTVTV